ncbi:hypothetical protein [Streptomyces sp. KR80]|uniref:hypothetical protein n=1 Tax=Streptomyces sp. KR80 TaxID=3457426 RepID=UPI003FD271E2
MTHSGQGNEPQLPAVPPAHEGVVLPAHGDQWTPEQQAAPAAGQPWGQPWGPEPGQQQAPAPPLSESPAQPLTQTHHEAPVVEARVLEAAAPEGAATGTPWHPEGAAATGTPWDPEGAAATGTPWDHPEAPAAQAPWHPEGTTAHAQPQPYPEVPAGQPQPQAAASFDDAQATQLIPPISGDGGSPVPPEAMDQATQFLGRRPLPPENGGPDAEATQYIAPVAAEAPAPPSRAPFAIRPGMPGDRQPPSEFDGLFRSEGASPGASGAADATQQIPRFEQQPEHGVPYGEHESDGSGWEAGRRRGLSPVALVGIVVAGCAIAGLAAGAALSSGGDEDTAADKRSETAAIKSEDGEKADPAADPAEEQAKSLDALLADSNDSRATVIKSVENIKSCRNLGQAAQDLRGAANQRNALVTRLQKISVDKLPDHQALTASLTRAWKASAAADNHYAAWADQVAAGGRKSGCHKGQARSTGQTAAGNRASGEATKAKQQSAGLWNTIAGKYGLEQRQYTQL